jgi:hypothetical protein
MCRWVLSGRYMAGVTLIQHPRCECGAALADSGDWCLRCYRPRAVSEERGEDPSPQRPSFSIPQRRKPSGLRRWDASAVTFALRGRIIATIVFTLPLLWFLYFLVPFGFVGVVTYGMVYPRILRDIWTRADRL